MVGDGKTVLIPVRTVKNVDKRIGGAEQEAAAFSKHPVSLVKNRLRFGDIGHRYRAEYQVVFMDIQMPKMDGYTATREIRTLNDSKKANIPIIAMTANAFTKDKLDAIEAGMNEHLAKPLDINLLLEIISKYKHKISRFR